MDLQIYKKGDLESTSFIEIINPKKGHLIIACIYRHYHMDLNDFNDYLNPLLAKLSKEKETVFLLGDYNLDLSKYEQHSTTAHFIYVSSIHNSTNKGYFQLKNYY